MSEIKGALLGIVLAISAFTMVFGIISFAMRDVAETVSDRMDTAAELDPTGTVVIQLP